MNFSDFTQVKKEGKVEAEIKKEIVEDNFDAHEEGVMDFINSKEFDNKIKSKFDNNLIEKTIEPMNKKQGTIKINTKKTETKFMCGKCGALFTRKDILQLHITEVHEKLKPFKCDECQASFTLKFTLDHHVKAVHDQLKPFKCSKCDTSYLREIDLQLHVSQKHEKNKLSCEICGLSFPQKVDLQLHISGEHQKKKFAC